MFIAKLQKSLTAPCKVLIYNESHTIQREQLCTPELEKLFGDKLKLYAKCHVNGKNEIEIGSLVKAQSW